MNKEQIKLQIISLRVTRREALAKRDFVMAVKILQEIVRLRKLLLPMLVLFFTVIKGGL